MAISPEAVDIAAAALAIVTVAVHYYIHKRFHTWFFTFGLLCSTAIAVSLQATRPALAVPQAPAVVDIGVLLAGCTAFASSAWLCFAFKTAGEPGDR